jgi:Zn-dependent protease
MASRAALRVFGIPFTVRAGFLVFLGLVVLANPGPTGWWFAVAVTAFTTVHELGHAFMARSFGATPSIALDFLAGYTSYQPSRALAPWERATIAVAGPVANILPGLVILLLLGSNPLSVDDVSQSPAQLAIWWAGPVIGLLNLLPILPLDGGTILASGIDAVAPGRGRRIMAVVSLVATAVLGWILLNTPQWRPFLPVAIFLAVMQIQELAQIRPRRAGPDGALMASAAALAERSAWATGTVPLFPPPYQVSPWFRAHQLLERGQAADAVQVLLATSEATTPRYCLPDTAPPRALGRLADLLPAELPARGTWGELYLVQGMQLGGRTRQAGEYAAAVYGRTREPRFAYEVAAAATALGEQATALAWLRTAAPATPRARIEAEPRFEPLRAHPEFAAITRQAQA